MSAIILRFTSQNLCLRRLPRLRNGKYGSIVIFMDIVKRKIRFFMAAILLQMVGSYHGRSSDFCQGFSLRKPTCSVSKTVDLKLSRTRLALVASSPGNSSKSLIRLH